MKLQLTKGMFGDVISQIGDETDNVKTILEYIFNWKSDENNLRNYKVEPYDRFIFDNKNNRLAIDFGDYEIFMLITDVSDDKKEQFINI